MGKYKNRLLNFTIDIEGVKDYNENLAKSIPLLKDFEYKFLTTVANKVMRKAMKRTPVDTGRLRRSYKVTKVTTKGNTLEITVYNDARDNGSDESYASYVEFGHFTRGRVKYIDGVYMLTMATDEVKAEMERTWKRMVRKWAKEAGI